MLQIVCQRFTWDSKYVNVLYDMVRRNLRSGIEGKFVCFTDDPEGLDEGIEVRPLPYHLDKNYEDGELAKAHPWGPGLLNRMPMFKRGMFPDGDRIIFIDLDTLLVGSLDEIFAYDGEFAVLRDFYRPDGLQFSFAMWRAGGKACEIYDQWHEAGEPLDIWDQGWIEKVIPEPDILQRLFPETFYSYKAHCYPYPPLTARVICFHGLPKPHDCGQPWVEKAWQVGGMNLLSMTVVPNTPDETLLANVKINSHRDLEWVTSVPEHDGHAVIVGSAPSLIGTIEDIRRRQENGQVIFALNNAANVLEENGIIADYQVIMDARKSNIELLCHGVKKHLLASQAHPSLFDAVQNVTLWHGIMENMESVFPEKYVPYSLIGGGTTVGLSSMCLAYTMGYRQLHLYGYDSSHKDGSGHALPQSMNEKDWILEVMVGNQVFSCSAAMAAQAYKFPVLADRLADLDCVITVHGDGLLPTIARQMQLMIQNPISTVIPCQTEKVA